MRNNVFTKLISLVIALVLALSVCLPASATSVEVSTYEKYQTVLNEVVQEKYEEVIAAESKEEVEAILLTLTEENIAAIMQRLDEEKQTKWQEHIEYLHSWWYGFTQEEVETFTKGFYVNGSMPMGEELRQALFAIEDDHAFRVAVNQYSYDQGGSMEAVVTDSEADRIVNAMVHLGFDVTGTSADVSGSYTRARYALKNTRAGTELPQWPNEGAIKLDKDAVAVAGKDEWEVTLQIQGKNYKTTSDVVLVIDNSNSMYNNQSTRAANTKTAAEAFVNQLLTENSTTRIAVVVFGTGVPNNNVTGFYSFDQKDELITYIRNIRQQMNGDTGGTNIQAGLHRADQLLSSADSTGKQKSIVLLGDGEPTYAYRFTGTATATSCRYAWNGWGYEHVIEGYSNVNVAPDYSTVIGSGSSWSRNNGNAVISVTCSHGTEQVTGTVSADGGFTDNTNTNLGTCTIWEANQIKKKGTTIFSVSLQAGSNGESVLRSCATDDATGYYEIASNERDIVGKLTSAFTSIAGSIAIAASKGIVLDPMGEKVELAVDGNPTITNDLSVYNAGNADVYISQGSIVYDDTTKKFDWDVGSVNEGTPVVLKYKVRIRDEVEVATGEIVPTNKTTTFSYLDYQDVEQTQEFPIPEVTLGGGTIMVHWYLVDENGNPINSEGTVVEGKEFAYQIQTAAYHTVDGSQAMEYNTQYPITAQSFNGYTYYGYTWNTATGTQSTVNVTVPPTASSQHVWFAYYEVKNGSLAITKNVSDAAFTTGSFTFTVTPPSDVTLPDLSGVSGVTVANNVATVVVPITSGTGTVMLPDLPAGDYTVEETGATNYNTTVAVGTAAAANGTSANVSVPAGEAATVTFNNTRKMGDLKVSKVVEGVYAPDDSFTIAVTLTGAGNSAYAYKVYNTADNKEVADAGGSIGGSLDTIELKNGQYALIDGIPQGATYKVEETNVDTSIFGVSYTGQEGTISETTVAEAVVTNTHQVGSLTITKTVNKTTDDYFVFQIKQGTTEIMKVYIQGGGSTTISNLPAGNYTVSELESAWRYTLADDETVTVETGKTASVSFHNVHETDQWLDDEVLKDNEYN